MSARTPEELLLLLPKAVGDIVLSIPAAVGAPTIGIFGDTSPVRHAPWGERAVHVGELCRWPDVQEVREAFEKLKGDRR